VVADGPALARVSVSRATEQRVVPEALAAMWADRRTRVLRIDEGRAPVSRRTGRIALAAPGATGRLSPSGEGCYFLGIDERNMPFFAVDAPFEAGPTERVVTLRAVGSQLCAQDCGLFAHASALSAWHARTRFCSSCGAATSAGSGGHVRTCSGCPAQHFPRTDPAVIALVKDRRGRVLLARNAAWPQSRYSTVAGFVEPGESPEAAVAREVFEETDLMVDQIRYQGSQPWPFPSSVMLAFEARVVDTALHLDANELGEARWFSRRQLVAAVDTGAVRLPSAASVARWQVERWLGAALESNQDW
jgi:NAD+ diphosphatase